MTIDDWIENNVPKKSTLSSDAVEILVKLAWNAALEDAKLKALRQKEDDMYGDDTVYPDTRRRY